MIINNDFIKLQKILAERGTENLTFGEHSPGQPEKVPTVGGTHAKSIMGVNKYGTKFQVYQYLTNPEEYSKLHTVEPNIPMLLGSYLEKPVLEIVYNNQDLFLGSNPRMTGLHQCDGLQIKQGEHISCHIDGYGRDTEGNFFIVEVKNYSTWAHQGYPKPDIAERVQIAHYQNILQADYTYLIVRIDNTIKVFKIERDQTLENSVRDTVREFYEEFVMLRVEPAVIDADIDFLSANIEVTQDQADLTLEEEEALQAAANEYAESSVLIKEETKRKDNAKAAMLYLLNTSLGYENDAIRVKRTVMDGRITADIDKLKAHGIFKNYSKQGDKIVRLTVKIK